MNLQRLVRGATIGLFALSLSNCQTAALPVSSDEKRIGSDSSTESVEETSPHYEPVEEISGNHPPYMDHDFSNFQIHTEESLAELDSYHALLAAEDARLDELIDSFSDALLYFPLTFNRYRLVDMQNPRDLDSTYSGRPNYFQEKGDTQVLNSYQYGDNVLILSNDPLDAMYVGRSLELLKRRAPLYYENLIEDPEHYDNIVFYFDNENTMPGAYAAMFVRERGTVYVGIDKIRISEGTYSNRLSNEWEYDGDISPYFATMRDVFPIGGIVHELLHHHYRDDQPFFHEFRHDYQFSLLLEHINIASIEIELVEQLGTTDYTQWYKNWVLDGFYIPQLDDYSERSLIDDEYITRLKTYRPFE